VDEAFEQLAFDFFLAEAKKPGTACAQIHDKVIPRTRSAGSPWHEKRSRSGTDGALAMLARPLVSVLGGMRIDSAQLMQALLVTVDGIEPIQAYASFWSGFVAFAEPRIPIASSRTLQEAAALEPLYAAASELAQTVRCSVVVT
jgi:hypothetical protein